jgi:osmoprotectant transport system ATP-binding protein
MAAPRIELDDVAKAFGQGLAVHDLSLAVPAGAFVALVGASGSGKTTTLKMINGLVVPDSGQVRIDGRPIGEQPGPILRRSMGYVFQGVGLFPHLTVAENIAATPRLLGWDAASIFARQVELLDMVALPQAYASRMPDQLSGGERQRVGVARALAARPSIMLMDEPFGALDPVTRDGLGTAYRALHDQLGLTTVMVTHDVQEAVLLADRIVVMSAGRIVADGAPGTLLAGHASAEASALMAMPRRQAERIRTLLESSGREVPLVPPHG